MEKIKEIAAFYRKVKKAMPVAKTIPIIKVATFQNW